jgi:hypothetical protein
MKGQGKDAFDRLSEALNADDNPRAGIPRGAMGVPRVGEDWMVKQITLTAKRRNSTTPSSG